MSDETVEEVVTGETMPDKIEEMLQEGKPQNLKDAGVSRNLYRGRALNDEELYQMSAKEDTEIVLVAGMYHSGKTTMELAMYQMFLRGKNKKLKFAGSRTLCGVVERSKGLRATSGNSESEVPRTSDADPDKFFHLVVMDTNRKKHNMVFTDFPGEYFERKADSTVEIDSGFERFRKSKQVILLVDGEKLAGVECALACMESKELFSRLLMKGIVDSHTLVHIVYTKNDMISSSDNPNINKIIENNDIILKEMAEKTDCHIRFYRISAISKHTDQVKNFEGLEELLEACLVNLDPDMTQKRNRWTPIVDKSHAQRGIDKFAWKG